MANEEQLSILKQGVEVWNEWRDANPQAKIDFYEANLSKRLDLNGANFKGADFRKAILTGAFLHRALFIGANMSDANMIGSHLNDASFMVAELNNTNLMGAQLNKADFSGADLSGANLDQSHLSGTNLSGAVLNGANFSRTYIGATIFVDIDFSKTKGLEEINHQSPSHIGMDTIKLSKGSIPEVFLRGCGISDVDIEYAKLSNPDLSNEEINKIMYKMYDLRATQALQISPLFISYSHGDSIFVDKLESQLNKKGVRFWRDKHDMKAGRIETQIDRAISQNRTVLLVLSEHSIKSDWVEHEVRTARGLEKDMGRDVLCPIALDESWQSSPWPKRVMEQITEKYILDFSDWEDDVKFEDMFRKLIDGLELFYKS